MTIEEIREKILTDADYVQSQIDLLASYFQLKHTIRWAHKRIHEDETESVAEHIFGLHILIDYFFPLVDDYVLDLNKIRHLATWHDMAEAFVGDMTTRAKTQEHKDKEKEAEQKIIESAPQHLQDILKAVYNEFDARITPESKFVKALDRIEPFFYLYFLSKKTKDYTTYFDLGWTAEEYRSHRHPFVSEFGVIKRFDDILYENLKVTNFHPKKLPI
ncbi:MAG: HD domain-containing protein [Candidatus Pacebacteria bacterium]|nr:HD domain-containing protein [Candidatus Paceibacterota bacterium]